MQPSELRLIYDTGVTDGDPSNGRIRLDCARLSLARNVYVNKCDLDGVTLDRVSPKFNLGDTLIIMCSAAITKVIVTGPVRNRGPYFQIPIKVRSVEGSFTAGEILTLFRVGDIIDEPVPVPAVSSTKVEMTRPAAAPDPKIKDLEIENATLKAALEHLLDDDTEIVTVMED